MRLKLPSLPMLVPAKPQPILSSLLGGEAIPLGSPWRHCSFFPSGRDALAASLAKLRPSAGASVALPAFICRSVPDRLTRLGYNPYFVDSSVDSPNPTADAFGKACSNETTEVLLLVNYFGFFSEERLLAAESARAKGCVVVEDRCHSALTKPTDEVADAVVYSIRKSLPCPDGGALWLPKKEKLSPQSPLSTPSLLTSIPFLFVSEVERLVCWLGWPNIYSLSLIGMLRNNLAGNSTCERLAPRVVPSVMPSWLLNHQLHKARLLVRAAEQRRMNFLRLTEVLRSMTPIFDLEAGTVPQTFPVADPSGELAGYLRNRGVGAYRWPGDDLPAKVLQSAECFPNALRWNHNVVCLPIHQTITTRHIHRMAELIDQFVAAGG